MANTYTDLFIENVTDVVIGALRKDNVPLSAFSTDVSPQAMSEKGKTVKVPLVTAPTANTFTNYSANANTADTTADVSVNQHKVATFHVTEAEAAFIEKGVWGAAAREKVEGAVHSVVDSVLQYAFGLVLTADYASGIKILPADFDGQTLGSLRTWANQQGFSKSRRSIVAGSDYMETLMGDPTLAAYFAQAEQTAIRDGKVMRLKGFNLVEYDGIPANGESLEGIVVDPRALAVAIRPVELLGADSDYIRREIITDADSGLSVSYRIWYDRNTGAVYHNIEAMFGAAKARTTALRRITSA